jgi:hypothetical protein
VALVASMSALAMGYDTAVIGGTMALDSFRRDFALDQVESKVRDTIQGNIVSTFQVNFDCWNKKTAEPEADNHRPDVSSVHFLPSRSRKNMVEGSRSSFLHWSSCSVEPS